MEEQHEDFLSDILDCKINVGHGICGAGYSEVVAVRSKPLKVITLFLEITKTVFFLPLCRYFYAILLLIVCAFK